MEEIIIENIIVTAFGSSSGQVPLDRMQQYINSGVEHKTIRHGNWVYELNKENEDSMLHITLYSTEVITVNVTSKEVTKTQSGGWERSQTTSGGISKHLGVLSGLGYSVPDIDWSDKYYFDINENEEQREKRRTETGEEYVEEQREKSRARYRRNKDERLERKKLQEEYPEEIAIYLKLRETHSSWHYRDFPSEFILKDIRKGMAIREKHPEAYEALSKEFGIVTQEAVEDYMRNKKNREFEERWSRRGADTPNVEYAKLMKFSGLKKKAEESEWTIYAPNYIYDSNNNLISEGRTHITEFECENLDDQSDEYIITILKTNMMLPEDTKKEDVELLWETDNKTIYVIDPATHKKLLILVRTDMDETEFSQITEVLETDELERDLHEYPEKKRIKDKKDEEFEERWSKKEMVVTADSILV